MKGSFLPSLMRKFEYLFNQTIIINEKMKKYMDHKRLVSPEKFLKPKKRYLSVPPITTVHNLEKMSLEQLQKSIFISPRNSAETARYFKRKFLIEEFINCLDDQETKQLHHYFMEKFEKIQQKCIYLKEEISDIKQKLQQDKKQFF